MLLIAVLQSGVLRLPGVEFTQPVWLCLAPALWLALWWIARGALGGWHSRQQAAHLLIRCIAVAAVVLALAEPSLRRTATDVAVVVVHDVSDSVPPDQQQLADAFVRASSQRRTPADRLGVITTAADAIVQALPAPRDPPQAWGYTGDPNATNLESALRLAAAMLPGDAGGRVLLISDGNQTRGNLAAAVNAARAARVPIDVAAVEYDRAASIRVKDVVIPAWARENDTVNAKVVIESGRHASGRLSLLINGTMVDLDPDTDALSTRVALVPGLNVFNATLRLSGASVHRVDAVFDPDAGQDARQVARQANAQDIPELLRASGVTFTSSRGRVFVVTDDPQSITPFLNAIRTENLVIDTGPAFESPRTLSDLAAYDAVVLADQPASNFSQAHQEALVRFVHDAGGGLLVLGGPSAFGAGGWIGSPLADALPLLLDPPQKRQMPMGALAIVIDRSGSMSAPVSGTAANQQQVANEAAILGIRALSRLDQVAVIAFSGEPERIVPLTHNTDPDSIARHIRTIGPGGGTNLFPAIDAAAAELAKSPAAVKHIVILTDGQTVGDPRDSIALAGELKRRGVTLTTVAIGDIANDDLLVRIAAAGGGRTYTVSAANSLAVLPQIFIKEALTIRRALIWEGPPFTPRHTPGDLSLRGIAAPFPAITGYVVTAERAGLATVALRAPPGDPILAHWQHGLGRVTAFTSDATSRWNAPWIGWGSYAPFWRQQLLWTIRPTGDPLARVHVHAEGERARVTLELLHDTGERMNFAQVHGRVIHPGTTRAGNASDIRLRQVGPGRYEGEVDVINEGVHLVALRYDAPSNDASGPVRRQGSIRAAITRRAGDELRSPTPATELLWQAARDTNGRIYRLDTSGVNLWTRDDLQMPVIRRSIWLLLAAAAVALFLADVAARRITLDIPRLRAWVVALASPAAPRPSPALAGLAAARARAADAWRDDTAPAAKAVRPVRDQPADRYAPPPRVHPSSATPLTPTPTEPPAPRVQPATEPEPANAMERLRAAKRRSLRD